MRWIDLRKTLKAGISNLNDIFAFFNPKELLENDHHDKWETGFRRTTPAKLHIGQYLVKHRSEFDAFFAVAGGRFCQHFVRI